ncbi:MAG: septum formation initiator family protein [Bacteroidales bacterium]|nr:septum formation initiator family protein [Bacteroidales bacterium]
MRKFFNWCRRYLSGMLLIVVAFVLFVLFFNDNSIMKSYEYSREIERLEKEIAQNEDTLTHYLQLNRSLDTDPVTMERIVREQYHMQRPNEDVYVFEE